MKKNILFVASCLLLLAACSKDDGKKGGRDNFKFDEKSVNSVIGKKLLSSPAWCDQYFTGSSESESVEVLERSAFKNDSTMLQTTTEIKSGNVVESHKIGWTIDNDRVVWRGNVEGQDREMSFVPVFQTKDGKECYQMTSLIVDGKPLEQGENSAPSIKCSCN